MSSSDPSVTDCVLSPTLKSNGLASSQWAPQMPSPLPPIKFKSPTTCDRSPLEFKGSSLRVKDNLAQARPISAIFNMENAAPPRPRRLQDTEEFMRQIATENAPHCQVETTLGITKAAEWVPPHLRWVSSATASLRIATESFDRLKNDHAANLHKSYNNNGSPELDLCKEIGKHSSAANHGGGNAESNTKNKKEVPESTQRGKIFGIAHKSPWQAVHENKDSDIAADQSKGSVQAKTPKSCAPSIPYNTKPKPQPIKKENSTPTESRKYLTAKKKHFRTDGIHDQRAQYSKEPGLRHPAAIHAAIMQDISLAGGCNTVRPLTRELLVETTGSAPPESMKSGLSNAISDDGVENEEEMNNQPVGDSRAWIAPHPNGLLDWSGGWAPVPAGWETDRGGFSNNFIPEYIKSWRNQLPEKNVSVNIVRKEFLGGSPLVHGRFILSIKHPTTFPDVENSDNIVAQRNMTSEISGRMQSKKLLRATRHKDMSNAAETERLKSIATRVPEANPNSPTIAIYIRPAMEKDIPGVMTIYNYYVEHSIIPEDQVKVTSEDIYHMWKTAQDDFLPFIVAIKGRMPKNISTHAAEVIVGFAVAEGYYGARNTIGGRSRFTASIHFYTHYEYLRKGIARSLLDRLLQCMSSNHGAKDGYEWANPESNKVYDNLGGSKRYHQIQIELPIELKNDRTHTWLKDWLESKFYFKQVARFLSTSRSTTAGGPARWLDIVYFQLEASSSAEFDTYI